MVESTVSSIETGTRGTSLRNVGLIAKAMACGESDLFNSPTPHRLAEISAAYYQRKADAAREEARAAS